MEKDWPAYPFYRVFDDSGSPVSSSLELSNKSYGTDACIAITDVDAAVPNLIVTVWETKDSENYDGSGRAVVFRDLSTNTGISYSFTNGSQSKDFQLYQNFPNPFNNGTTILYRKNNSTHVKMAIYNSIGQRIKTPVDANQHVGNHIVHLDATDLSSGVYIIQLQIDEQTKSIKVFNLH